MIEKQLVDKHLAKTVCPRCEAPLSGAQVIPVSEVPFALVAHVVCPNCQAESMVTITMAGSGVTPVKSDLTGNEIKEFIGKESVSVDELLSLHKLLRKGSLWKLLQKKEKNSVKKPKQSKGIENSQL